MKGTNKINERSAVAIKLVVPATQNGNGADRFDPVEQEPHVIRQPPRPRSPALGLKRSTPWRLPSEASSARVNTPFSVAFVEKAARHFIAISQRQLSSCERSRSAGEPAFKAPEQPHAFRVIPSFNTDRL